MICGDWFPGLYCIDMKDKLGLAPQPVGQHGEKDVVFGGLNGLSIAEGCDNPEGAGIFLTWMQKRSEKYSDGTLTPKETPVPVISQELMDLQKKINNSSKIALPLWYGLGNWDSQYYLFWADIQSGIPPASNAEKWKPVLEKEISAALVDKIPDIKEFTAPAPEDFESGTVGIMTTTDCTPVSADATKDAADIVGGTASLKIAAPDAGGFIIRTDETKIQLPSYHTYTVTFDYKLIKAPASGGYFVVMAIPKANMSDWAKYYGWNQMPAAKDGDTGTYTCDISIDKASEDNVLVIYNTGGGIIVIDNLTIKEK